MADIFSNHESNNVHAIDKPICDGAGCNSTPIEKLIIKDKKIGSKAFFVCGICFDKISRIQKAFQEIEDN
jgi:hypothetical protein